MKIKSSALTDVGRKRDHNEDSYVENHSLGLFAVADGMGGHNAGEVASAMAVDILSAEVHRHEKLLASFKHGPTLKLKRQILNMLEAAVLKICKTIYDTAQAEKGKQGMGTTLSSILIMEKSGFIAHVGDSRIYLIRDGDVHQVTQDHTLLQDQVKKGLLNEEAAKNFPYKNVVTRAVGVLESIEVDVQHIEMAAGDTFLICSDGLYDGGLSLEEISGMFDTNTLEEVTRRLIELANERGGKDNITTVALEIPELALTEGEIEVNRKLELLRKINLFESLSYSELVKVLNIVQIDRKSQGDIIIREGDAGDKLYIIVNGSVDVMKDEVYLTSLQRGGHFGEMALIDNDLRSATVRAREDCDLLLIERNDFYPLLKAEPHLSVKILLSFVGVLSSRLRETTRVFSEWKKRVTDITALS